MPDRSASDHGAVKDTLRAQRIETPSWTFGNSGTRFKVVPQPGVPRTPQEKIADAAQVHKYTGIAPSMAIHIPWDRVDDYADLARCAADAGITIGAVNANVFQDPDYMLGSVANPDPAVRRKAVGHLLDTEALAAAQQAGDVLGANAALMDAYNTDVRPLLAGLRQEMGLDPDPVAAYHRSGYAEKITADRTGGTPASWGS